MRYCKNFIQIITMNQFTTDSHLAEYRILIVAQIYIVTSNPSQHGCILNVSLRRLTQRLRDISKKADLQISETSSGKLIKDVSSETSQRSLRFSWIRLWVASETVILGLHSVAFFGYLFIYLRILISFAKLNWYGKLLRAWLKLEIYLRYLYKRITLLD